MANLPKNILDLSDLLSSLPGIGPKLSSRLALYLSLSGKDKAMSLRNSLERAVKEIRECSICGNVSIDEICNICSDEGRDTTSILVVEDSLDLYNIDSSGDYKGLYHVLHGVISPVNGIGPNDININSLIKRLREKKDIKEIILGLNPNLEGDSTSMYIKNEISNIGRDVRMTKLAKGIPVGSDIEFMSSQTLSDSVKSRTEF